jgi:hypothetical protein
MSDKHNLTRTQLFELVWSEPTSVIAQRFSVSGVALRKACIKAAVPVPPRGYWAKLRAGKRVRRPPLPRRPPGMAEELRVGGRGYYSYSVPTEEEILGPLPEAPVFEEPIEQVRAEALALTARARAARDLSRPHTAVERLLNLDRERSERYLNSTFKVEWNKPYLDNPVARRRLRILSGLFAALDRAGGRPAINDPQAEDVGIAIHDSHVSIQLSPAPKSGRKRGGNAAVTPRQGEGLRLTIKGGYGAETAIRVWEDGPDARLEQSLPEIAAEIVVCAEVTYRKHLQRIHEWRIQQRAELQAEREQRRLQAERKERERVEALARERIERRLAQADALRRAEAIREYVRRVEERMDEAGHSIAAADFGSWREWALAIADDIDPVVSGEFIRMP